MGYLKGKSTLMIYDRHPELHSKWDKTFWTGSNIALWRANNKPPLEVVSANLRKCRKTIMPVIKEKTQILKRINSAEKISLKPAILLSLAVCFMLFLYAPIETYFLNKDEFWYDIYILVPIMFFVFAIAYILCVLVFKILGLISVKLYNGCIIVGFIAFICTWIQGNYLVKNLPVIDGTEIDWDLYIKGRIESIILWITVVILTFVLLKFVHITKFIKFVMTISGCLTLFFVLTLIMQCVTNDGLEKKTIYV